MFKLKKIELKALRNIYRFIVNLFLDKLNTVKDIKQIKIDQHNVLNKVIEQIVIKENNFIEYKRKERIIYTFKKITSMSEENFINEVLNNNICLKEILNSKIILTNLMLLNIKRIIFLNSNLDCIKSQNSHQSYESFLVNGFLEVFQEDSNFLKITKKEKKQFKHYYNNDLERIELLNWFSASYKNNKEVCEFSLLLQEVIQLNLKGRGFRKNVFQLLNSLNMFKRNRLHKELARNKFYCLLNILNFSN